MRTMDGGRGCGSPAPLTAQSVVVRSRSTASRPRNWFPAGISVIASQTADRSAKSWTASHSPEAQAST